MGQISDDYKLQLTVGVNANNRVFMNFDNTVIRTLELDPTTAIEIGVTLIGAAFQVTNDTRESKDQDTEGKADERQQH